MKQIKDFQDYSVTEDGRVISFKSGEPREIKPWLDSKGNYLMVGLSVHGKVAKKLVHRLVAQTYIPNPNNLPEVNHKDKNKTNNSVENLEWCDRIYNLYQSYETMSPVRNYKECFVLNNGILIGQFQSKAEACRFVSEAYGVSYTSLNKYGKCRGFEIVERLND